MIINFDYRIDVIKAGVKIGELNNASAIQFENIQNSGCGNFSLTIARRFDDFADIIDYNNEIKIYINNVLYFTGMIIDYIPNLDLSENIQINGTGFVEQLNWQLVTNTYSSIEVSALMEDLVTTYILPYGDITIGTIEPMGYIIDSITFEALSVKECLQTLQELAGINIVEVDENKQFNVKIRTTTDSLWDVAEWDTALWDAKTGTAHYVFVGDKVQEYNTINTSSNLRNSITFRGGRVAGVLFTDSLTDPVSITAYGERQTLESNSAITNHNDAVQYLSSKLDAIAYPTSRTTLTINNYTTLPIKAGDVINLTMPDASVVQHFVISAGYDISDAGVKITIQADSLTPQWNTSWKRLERRLSNVQNQNL